MKAEGDMYDVWGDRGPLLCVGSSPDKDNCFYCICAIPDVRFLYIIQVELVQQVIDGVTLLVNMEKRLEKRLSIEHLVPK